MILYTKNVLDFTPALTLFPRPVTYARRTLRCTQEHSFHSLSPLSFKPQSATRARRAQYEVLSTMIMFSPKVQQDDEEEEGASIIGQASLYK